MLFVVMIVQAVLIGMLAQMKLRRIGVIWAVIALALSVAFAMFLDNAITSQPEWQLSEEYRRSRSTTGHDIAFMLMSVGGSAVVTLLVLLTLPKRKQA